MPARPLTPYAHPPLAPRQYAVLMKRRPAGADVEVVPSCAKGRKVVQSDPREGATATTDIDDTGSADENSPSEKQDNVGGTTDPPGDTKKKGPPKKDTASVADGEALWDKAAIERCPCFETVSTAVAATDSGFLKNCISSLPTQIDVATIGGANVMPLACSILNAALQANGIAKRSFRTLFTSDCTNMECSYAMFIKSRASPKPKKICCFEGLANLSPDSADFRCTVHEDTSSCFLPGSDFEPPDVLFAGKAVTNWSSLCAGIGAATVGSGAIPPTPRFGSGHDSAVAYIPHARYTFIRMYVGLFYNHSLLTPVWSNVLMLLFICLSSSHYLEEVLLAFHPMILRHGSASSLASTLVVPAPLASFVF